MRVLHVMPSMHPSYGGPVAAMRVMARGLRESGVQVDVVTVASPVSLPPFAFGEWQIEEGFRQICLPVAWRPGSVSPQLNRWLLHNLSNYDLLHVHGVFTYPSLVARKKALVGGVPYIVRPLGILNKWGMEKRRPWLKKAFFQVLEKRSLDRAAALHFTSWDEANDVARLHIEAPVVVIPLGLDLKPYEELPSKEVFYERFPRAASGPVILFLSRIDQKKGLDLLLPAFQKLLIKEPNATLVVAGDGSPHVVAALRQLADSLGIGEKVIWTGFVGGELRLAAFAASTVFCLPSRSENFGMALLEAMSAGLPCLTTAQVALGVEAARADAVVLTELSSDCLADALAEMLMNADRRRQLSAQAAHYAKEHHSMGKVGTNLKDLYQKLLVSFVSRQDR